jgi:hypothetical protein
MARLLTTEDANANVNDINLETGYSDTVTPGVYNFSPFAGPTD